MEFANEVLAHINESGPKGKLAANMAAIRALKSVESGAALTQELASQMALFTGFGGLKKAFETEGEWATEAQELQSMLTPEEYCSLNGSILNAHYTHPCIVAAMWDILAHLGFNGKNANILDASAGMGYFRMFAPGVIRDANWTMIELDEVTGRLAGSLHGFEDVRVHGFEHFQCREEVFDLAISNIPFGDYKVWDNQYPELSAWRIHNYFLAKKILLTRPGGLIAVITSTGFFDSKSNTPIRKWVAGEAKLLAAYRLPDLTFQKFGTQVTTDILLFQRLPEKERKDSTKIKDGDYDWLVPVKAVIGGVDYYYNTYFGRSKSDENAAHLIGRLVQDRLHPGRVGLTATEWDTPEKVQQRLIEVSGKLPGLIYRPSQQVIDLSLQSIPSEYAHIPPMSYCMSADGSSVVFRDENHIRPIKNETDCQRILMALSIYDALEQLLRVQREDSDTMVEMSRQALNDSYDNFFARFGALHHPTNRSILNCDRRVYELLSLEVEIAPTPTKSGKRVTQWAKADIFFRRTVEVSPRPTADNPLDALVCSLAYRGRLDLEWMAELLSTDVASVVNDLLSDGQIFKDPENQEWVLRDDYLSGKVRHKLAVAKEAEVREGGYQFNVDALTAVQPKFVLPPGDFRADVGAALGGEECCNTNPSASVTINPGSNVVPPEVNSQFIRYLVRPRFRDELRCYYAPSIARWTVLEDRSFPDRQKNEVEWGTPDVPAVEMFELLLNQKQPKVYDKDSEGNKIFNPGKTEAALAKYQQVSDEWNRWAWSDFDRALLLTKRFNDLFNDSVMPRYDGSHLAKPGVFPGLNPQITPFPHQLDAVWAAISGARNGTGVGWSIAVGGGKTLAAALLCVFGRKLGLVKKPMITVLNSTVEQIHEQFKYFFPGGKFLCPGKDDFKPENRRTMISAIRTGDWDAVILPHSQFMAIPVERWKTIEFVKSELKLVEADLAQQAREGGRATKALQRKQKSLVAKLEKLQSIDLKKNTVSWEQLGVDLLVVDEWSEKFKNLGFSTQHSDVAGLSPNSNSQRAIDCYLKFRTMQRNGHITVAMDGTFLRNSIAEQYTWMRFLMLEKMEEMGISSFDAWAANFGKIVTAPEIDSTGRFKFKSRFAEFNNLPLLRQMVAPCTVSVTEQELRRRLEESGIHIPKEITIREETESTDDQVALMNTLVRRAEAISSGAVNPDEDNMLWITLHGRCGCLDPRTIIPDAKNDVRLLLNRVALNIYRIWKNSRNANLVQSVFCDLSVPKRNARFTAYEYLRDVLVAMGMPAEGIVFAQDLSGKSRETTFQQCNQGEIAVVKGSTGKLGTGVNIQQRLVVGHQIEPPWRPGDLWQRVGRYVRQRNLCEEVYTFYYITQGANGLAGFHSFMWQKIHTKAEFITNYMNASTDQWSMKAGDDKTLQYAELKAAATGDTRIIRKVEIDSVLTRKGYLLRDLNNRREGVRLAQKSLPDQIDRLVYEVDVRQRDFSSLVQLSSHHTQPEIDAGIFYSGLVKPDGTAESAIEVARQVYGEQEPEGAEEETEEGGKKKKVKPPTYLPLRYPLQFGTELVADPHTVGRIILEKIDYLSGENQYGSHVIAHWPIGNDVWTLTTNIIRVPGNSNAVAVYLKSPITETPYYVRPSGRPADMVKNIHYLQRDIDKEIKDKRKDLQSKRDRFNLLEPQADDLLKQIRQHESELAPLLEELRQIEEGLGLNKLEAGDDTASGGGEKNGDDDSSDDAEFESFLDMAAEHMQPALYDYSVEPWIVRELLEEAEGDEPDWLANIRRIDLGVAAKLGLVGVAVEDVAEERDESSTHQEPTQPPIIVKPTVEAIANFALSEPVDFHVELQLATQPFKPTRKGKRVQVADQLDMLALLGQM